MDRTSSRAATVVAVAVAGLWASSASAEVIFQGSLTVTARSGQCNGYDQGTFFNSVYHPRISGNLDFTALTYTFDKGAIGLQLDSDDFTASFKPVRAGGVGWGPYDWTGSKVRIIAKFPATVAATTRFARLRGQITKPNNDESPLCIINFEAAYSRDPNN